MSNRRVLGTVLILLGILVILVTIFSFYLHESSCSTTGLVGCSYYSRSPVIFWFVLYIPIIIGILFIMFGYYTVKKGKKNKKII